MDGVKLRVSKRSISINIDSFQEIEESIVLDYLEFISENSNFNQLLFRQAKLLNLSTPINDFIGVTIAVILLWFGGKEVLQNNNISSDGFIRYIMFLFAMLQPSRRLGTGIATIQTGIASADRVKSVLDIEIKEEKNKNILLKIDSFKNNIEFENV